MKKRINQFYSSPEIVIVELSSEQGFLNSSTFKNGVDNEEFENGGTFTDWI